MFCWFRYFNGFNVTFLRRIVWCYCVSWVSSEWCCAQARINYLPFSNYSWRSINWLKKSFALSLSKRKCGSTSSPRTASFYCALAILLDWQFIICEVKTMDKKGGYVNRPAAQCHNTNWPPLLFNRDCLIISIERNRCRTPGRTGKGTAVQIATNGPVPSGPRTGARPDIISSDE